MVVKPEQLVKSDLQVCKKIDTHRVRRLKYNQVLHHPFEDGITNDFQNSFLGNFGHLSLLVHERLLESTLSGRLF